MLDGLIKIREEIDGSLALRCSCRSAICGSCAMRVNGQAMLACNTKISDMLPSNGGPVVVEPMGNMGLVKDLVVDFDLFWDKVRAVKPWLQPEGPEPEAEYLAPNEDMLHLAGVMSCIMCGACVSDCTVMEVDDNFLGPAALAKAYRFVADPRDDADNERLGELNEYGGVWDCTRCMQCVEVCPKGVAPMDRIMAMRDQAMEAGYTNTYGARHAMAFADSSSTAAVLTSFGSPSRPSASSTSRRCSSWPLSASRRSLRASVRPSSTRRPPASRTSAVYSKNSKKSRTINEVRLLSGVRVARRRARTVRFHDGGRRAAGH